MPNYRRGYVPGGTFFFTVNLADRRTRLLTEGIASLRVAFATAKRRSPFRIDAIVVMPDHLHCIWTLPAGDVDFSVRWRFIKGTFSRSMSSSEERSPSRSSRRERAIWQRRFWEHVIRDDADYSAHVDYIHYNPVKHGHVRRVVDWPYSSFHRFVREGCCPADWAGGEDVTGAYGE